MYYIIWTLQVNRNKNGTKFACSQNDDEFDWSVCLRRSSHKSLNHIIIFIASLCVNDDDDELILSFFKQIVERQIVTTHTEKKTHKQTDFGSNLMHISICRFLPSFVIY